MEKPLLAKGARAKMEDSARFFSNKKCEYYPCHKMDGDLNCLFCYCPLYSLKNCPGNYEIKKIREREIKVCTNCTFPHHAENYDKIIRILRANM